MQYQTIGPLGTVNPPSHDTLLMGPPGCTTYPVGAFSSYAGSGNYD